MKFDELCESILSEADAIDNPKFNKWFKGSKVVDDNQNPLTVYHGARVEFTDFKKSKQGSNTDNGIYGKGFYFSKNEKTAQAYGNKIMPIYLNIKNPYYSNDFKTTKEVALYLGVDEDILKVGGTGVSSLQPYTGTFSSAIKDKGHDGVITRFGEYVVFSPTQIKSASGQNVDFSSSNPNIYK